MSSYSVVLFSLLIISSVILVSNFESSFAEKVIATSIGFEDSIILELKNSRGNTADINTVRIWLSGDNEFKSFKTEQGWMGKSTPQGVIIFTSQNEVKPGEGVKFGIKTTEKNPTINWKAVDKDGEMISSANTEVTVSETSNDKSELNESEIIGIKDNSMFRLIPEQPSSNSDFRVVGENFVSGQSLDFYIQDDFKNTVKVDDNGRILFTSKAPKIVEDERVEFILQDSGGNEKSLSLRILNIDKREISEIIKLSIGNTPNDVKRGETIIINGEATPNSTITITTKLPEGNVLNTNTILVGANGKWSYEKIFTPNLDLGNISIEVDDGIGRILRNFNVISAELINVYTEKTMYQPGDTVYFNGKALPNEEISISLENSVGSEIFSRSLSVNDSGNVDFEIPISRDAVEGTYILYLFQTNGKGITTFGVGQEPEPILILTPLKLNFKINESVDVLIQGVSNGQVSLILIDSSNREIFSDSINLGADGKELYKIDSDKLNNGSYTLSAHRGESTDEARFTVGFTTGSGIITVQTTRVEYIQGEQILILGKTGTANVILEVTISGPNGNVVKKFETFSDQNGVFKIDDFRIPMDGKYGIWKIDAKSGGNFDQIEFEVKGNENEITVELDKDNYKPGGIVNINGSGAEATITLKILSLEGGEKIDELSITPKSDGKYLTIWVIPADMKLGDYEITVDDGLKNSSIKFTIN
jgi:hypothetical protein